MEGTLSKGESDNDEDDAFEWLPNHLQEPSRRARLPRKKYRSLASVPEQRAP